MEIKWLGLAARLRGRRILDLRYEPEDGFVVLELADKGELWVSADIEGCQVRVAEKDPPVERGKEEKAPNFEPSSLFQLVDPFTQVIGQVFVAQEGVDVRRM